MITPCCPIPDYLDSAVTTLNPCPQDTGQIHKAIFWRQGNYLTVASALTATSWNTLLIATGSTKAIFTPFIHSFTLPLGEPREHTDTRDGATLRKANKSTRVEKKFLAEDQDVIKNLKRLKCEPLEVIFINEANQLIYSDREGDFRGFPIVNGSMFIGDKRFGGYSDWDSNSMIFNLEPAWSDSLEISASTNFALSSGVVDLTLRDYDDNIYTTVIIGSQEWIIENLKTTHYANGTDILNLTDDTEWENDLTGAYRWYDNNIANKTTYGALYNRYAVQNVNGLCYFKKNNVQDAGWRIATDDDWDTLVTYGGGLSVIGGKLKEIGTTHWQTPNTGATDEYGFKALPGGYITVGGIEDKITLSAYFWGGQWFRLLIYNGAAMTRTYGDENLGFSVRCVRDV